jgi:hypothetical protein
MFQGKMEILYEQNTVLVDERCASSVERWIRYLLAMSDFALLLNQVKQSALRLSSSISTSQDNNPYADEPIYKQSRQLDAEDFPSVEHFLLICPAGVQMGGPEALHQLCDQLNIINKNSASIMFAISSGRYSGCTCCGLVFAS